jgi:hypothetical protein
MDNTQEGITMKKVILTIFTLLLISIPYQGHAAARNLTGTMTNITSVPSGLLIMIDTGVPTDCTNPTIPTWMEIKETNKTMVSVALAMWVSGNKGVVVYVDGTRGVSGYCVITQFDPL